MPTLQEITLAHSQRLSEIHRRRDLRVAEAHALRDAQLRDLPAAAKAYQKFDDETAAAREKHIVNDTKAEAARHLALLAAIDHRGDRLDEAHAARRTADADAIEAKRRGDAAAERKYDAALAGLRDMAPADRDQAAQQAERARRANHDDARRIHDDALAAAQQQYRGAVDHAMLSEYRESREGERAYLEALGLGEAAARGATTAAGEHLADALARIPAAREVLRSWRQQLATIVSESKDAEAEAFARFRLDLETLKA